MEPGLAGRIYSFYSFLTAAFREGDPKSPCLFQYKVIVMEIHNLDTGGASTLTQEGSRTFHGNTTGISYIHTDL